MKPKSATTRILSLLALPTFLFGGLARATENPATSVQDQPSFSIWGVEEPQESVAVGDHVRIRLARSLELDARCGEMWERLPVQLDEVEGVVTTLSPDSLIIRSEEMSKRPIGVGKDGIRSLEVRRGRNSYALGGTVIGLAVGLALAFSHDTSNQGLLDFDFTPVAYGVIGPLVGLCVGNLLSTEQWEEVEFGGHRPAADTRGGFSLGWSVEF